jgi:hypothetical protein
MKDYFKYIKPEASKIFINAQKLHKVISRDGPEDVIHLYDDGDKLIVESPKAVVELNLLDNVVGACDKLPFNIDKKGLVTFDTSGPLENILKMPATALKEVVSYGKVLETDIYQFILDDKRKLTVLVGNLEGNSEKATYSPTCTVNKYTSPVNATLSLGMNEISETFSSDVTIQCKTNYPVWFSEENHKHRFGVLIAPRIEKVEE